MIKYLKNIYYKLTKDKIRNINFDILNCDTDPVNFIHSMTGLYPKLIEISTYALNPNILKIVFKLQNEKPIFRSFYENIYQQIN
jgi:hypothetical protein